MKKIIACITGVLGVLCIVAGFLFQQKKAVSVSIIGGADGPTSIFLAGKTGNINSLIPIIIGVILFAAAVLLLIVKRRKK